jgi:hypothetical protein
MSYDEEDAWTEDDKWAYDREREDPIAAYYDELERLFQEGLKSQAQEAVKSYLGRHGDAVDQRVLGSIAEAKLLLQHGHFGPALCAAAIAVELMIGYMLIRPLLQGAFLSDEWADILTGRIVTDKVGRDSDLVPIVLRQWGLDVTSVRSRTSKVPVWQWITTHLLNGRNNYLHRYDPVPERTAIIGVECAEAFRQEIVGALAKQLGFSLEVTGKWCTIDHPREVREPGTIVSAWSEEFEPADPFTRHPRRGRKPS